jgi:hypothetical protein
MRSAAFFPNAGTYYMLMDDSYLAEDVYRKPVIIYNYPKELKPFYVRLNDDGKTAAAFDMVVPKVSSKFLQREACFIIEAFLILLWTAYKLDDVYFAGWNNHHR